MMITYNGVTRSKAGWAQHLGVSERTLQRFLVHHGHLGIEACRENWQESISDKPYAALSRRERNELVHMALHSPVVCLTRLTHGQPVDPGILQQVSLDSCFSIGRR